MSDTKYSLFVRIDKPTCSPAFAHPKSESICQQIDFMRQYYHKEATEYQEKGSLYHHKVVLSTESTEIIFWLNQDEEGTADFVVYSLGLLKDVPFTKSLKLLLDFENEETRESLPEFVR